jgi:hypothetical protein
MFVFVASVKDTLDPFAADMLNRRVFRIHPDVRSEREIDGAATVPFPARNVPIVSVDAAVRLSCLPLLSVSRAVFTFE